MAAQLCPPDPQDQHSPRVLGEKVLWLLERLAEGLAPEESEAFSVLRLYVEDIREKMSEASAGEFLALLQEACHLVGTHGGKYMYLCASRDMGYDGCKQSSDFSDYYGKPVYVCSGGEVGGR